MKKISTFCFTISSTRTYLSTNTRSVQKNICFAPRKQDLIESRQDKDIFHFPDEENRKYFKGKYLIKIDTTRILFPLLSGFKLMVFYFSCLVHVAESMKNLLCLKCLRCLKLVLNMKMSVVHQHCHGSGTELSASGIKY